MMEQRNEQSELDLLLSNPFGDEMPAVSEQTKSPLLLDRLPKEQQEKAKQLAAQIDYKDYEAILKYGTAAQTQLSNFSQSMLDHLQKLYIGPIGDILAILIKKPEQINPE